MHVFVYKKNIPYSLIDSSTWSKGSALYNIYDSITVMISANLRMQLA